MPSVDVVNAVDVMKEGLGDMGARCQAVPPDQFCFYGFEKGLNGCVVVRFALARPAMFNWGRHKLSGHRPKLWKKIGKL